MIIITLAGASSRFFNEGYSVVKYKLEFNGRSVIENILSYIPRDEKILLILNEKFNDFFYIEIILNKLGFKKFQIVQISDTKGQLETLYLSLTTVDAFIEKDEEIVVYNGDTIRMMNKWADFPKNGYIEVFLADGNHWSFVDKIGLVENVTEKVRISNYCSSGLYVFENKKVILDNYHNYISVVLTEFYIAPFYQYLIKNKYLIFSGLVPSDSFIFCGTPSEYEMSITNYFNCGK